MRLKEGQYYYAPRRKRWGVWQHHIQNNGISTGIFINDFPTKEEARNEVYRLNGWFNK